MDSALLLMNFVPATIPFDSCSSIPPPELAAELFSNLHSRSWSELKEAEIAPPFFWALHLVKLVEVAAMFDVMGVSGQETYSSDHTPPPDPLSEVHCTNSEFDTLSLLP
jgi:hypothetical protein